MDHFENDRKSLSASDRLLQDLIRFDTTTEISPEKPDIDYIRTRLEQEGIETETFFRAEQRPNLLATLKSECAQLPPLLLYGHIDVVSTEGQSWTKDPFSASVSDGYIWGRGALDMKGELAMFLAAVIQIKRDGIPLPFDLKLLVVSDEEGTGIWGMAFLVREHPELFDGIRFALGEIGGFSMRISGKKLYPVMIAEKQFAHLKITAEGEGGHGSLSHSNTAMERLCSAVEKLSSQSLPVRITPPAEMMIKSMAAALGGVEAMVLKLLLKPSLTDRVLSLLGKQLELFKPLLHNNINVTMIEGGSAINVIPSQVSCHCDVRLVPGCTIEEAIKDVESVIGSSYEIEVVEYDQGAETLDLTLLDSLFEALRKKDPEAVPVPFVATGVTDGRFLSLLGIQTYGFTPMDLPEDLDFTSLIHAADERLPVGAVDFGKDVLADFICHAYAAQMEGQK